MMLLNRNVFDLRMPRFKYEATLFDGYTGADVNRGRWKNDALLFVQRFGNDVTFADAMAETLWPGPIWYIYRRVSLAVSITACYKARSTRDNVSWMMSRGLPSDLTGVDIHAANYVLGMLAEDDQYAPIIVRGYTADEWYTMVGDVPAIVLTIYPPTKYHALLMVTSWLEGTPCMHKIMSHVSVDTFAKAISDAKITWSKFMDVLRLFHGWRVKSSCFTSSHRGVFAKSYFAKNNADKRLCKWG
jgi:hypothetical protein